MTPALLQTVTLVKDFRQAVAGTIHDRSSGPIYHGSIFELHDVVEHYYDCLGDMQQILYLLPYSNEQDPSVYISMIESMISDGILKENPGFLTSKKELLLMDMAEPPLDEINIDHEMMELVDEQEEENEERKEEEEDPQYEEMDCQSCANSDQGR